MKSECFKWFETEIEGRLLSRNEVWFTCGLNVTQVSNAGNECIYYL